MSESLGRADSAVTDTSSRTDPAGDATAFAAALTAMSLTASTAHTDPLSVITTGAVDLIPGAEYSAVVLPAGPGRLEIRVASGPEPVEVGELESEVGEGPCLDAVRQFEPVWTADLATETRWPQFSPQVNRLGVGSMYCTPLAAGDLVYGSLSLASSQPDAFDEESRALAALFAAHATLALAGQAWRHNMSVALSSRDVIGQAKGILMERFRLTPDAAFAMLVASSQATHTKLRAVSEELCRTGVLPAR